LGGTRFFCALGWRQEAFRSLVLRGPGGPSACRENGGGPSKAPHPCPFGPLGGEGAAVFRRTEMLGNRQGRATGVLGGATRRVGFGSMGGGGGAGPRKVAVFRAGLM